MNIRLILGAGLSLLLLTLSSCGKSDQEKLLDKRAKMQELVIDLLYKDPAVAKKHHDKAKEIYKNEHAKFLKYLSACNAEDLKKIEEQADCGIKELETLKKDKKDLNKKTFEALEKSCPDPKLEEKCQAGVGKMNTKLGEIH